MSDWTFTPAQETPVKRIMKAFFWGSVAGALALYVAILVSQPNCPTEDSCKPQYTNGKWQIEEAKP